MQHVDNCIALPEILENQEVYSDLFSLNALLDQVFLSLLLLKCVLLNVFSLARNYKK